MRLQVNIHQMLRTRVSSAYDSREASTIYDADGTMVNSSTVWPVRPINIADRSYFKAFNSGTALTPMQFELVQSRVSGSWAIVASRRILGPDGEFLRTGDPWNSRRK